MKIKLKDGVYAEIKSVKIVFDLVDEEGTAIESGSVRQSPNSAAAISGSDLERLSIPSSLLHSEVFADE